MPGCASAVTLSPVAGVSKPTASNDQNSIRQLRYQMAFHTYVQQLRKTISGHFYFGVMCRETRRRIAISPDTSGGKQRYSHAGETIVSSCNHCHKTHRFDNRDIFSFAQ